MVPVVGEGGHDPDDADRAAAERLPVVRSEPALRACGCCTSG
nr:hypothetical protein [Angustibacter aerolatus]